MLVSAPRALDTPAELADATISKAIGWLDRHQTPEGFWVGMLESNYCMEAEWLLAMHFLGYRHPREKDLVATLLNAQRPDGSWEAYYQAVRRCWRFGQAREVEVHIFASDLEGAVVANLQRK